MQNRRQFLAASALTALSQSRVLGANDRVRIGAIGVGGRMQGLLSCLNKNGGNEIVAVCDVYEPRRQSTMEKFAPHAAEFGDYRKVLDRNDIDAVFIASPDHWHVRMTEDAVAAGKDVYVEKPITRTIEEGPGLIQAVRDSKRIVQIGLQQRSWEHFRIGAEMVQAGKLGKVTLVRTYWFQNYTRHNRAHIDIAKLDWKGWLGSRPDQPFSMDRFTTWRWYWDFGGGALTDLFTHWVDVVHWAMQSDTPQMAQTLGSQYDAEFKERDCPDTIQASFQYPNFMTIYDGTMVCSLEDGGLVFRGSEAMMLLDRNRLTVYPEGQGYVVAKVPATVDMTSKADGTIAHTQNFLDCVRSRNEPNCPVEVGVTAARAAHIGNLALRKGQRVTWPSAKFEASA